MDQAHKDRLSQLRADKEAGRLDPNAEKELSDLVELEGLDNAPEGAQNVGASQKATASKPVAQTGTPEKGTGEDETKEETKA